MPYSKEKQRVWANRHAKKLRAEYIAMGLTSRGTPRKRVIFERTPPGRSDAELDRMAAESMWMLDAQERAQGRFDRLLDPQTCKVVEVRR